MISFPKKALKCSPLSNAFCEKNVIFLNTLLVFFPIYIRSGYNLHWYTELLSHCTSKACLLHSNVLVCALLIGFTVMLNLLHPQNRSPIYHSYLSNKVSYITNIMGKQQQLTQFWDCKRSRTSHVMVLLLITQILISILSLYWGYFCESPKQSDFSTQLFLSFGSVLIILYVKYLFFFFNSSHLYCTGKITHQFTWQVVDFRYTISSIRWTFSSTWRMLCCSCASLLQLAWRTAYPHAFISPLRLQCCWQTYVFFTFFCIGAMAGLSSLHRREFLTALDCQVLCVDGWILEIIREFRADFSCVLISHLFLWLWTKAMFPVRILLSYISVPYSSHQCKMQ